MPVQDGPRVSREPGRRVPAELRRDRLVPSPRVQSWVADREEPACGEQLGLGPLALGPDLMATDMSENRLTWLQGPVRSARAAGLQHRGKSAAAPASDSTEFKAYAEQARGTCPKVESARERTRTGPWRSSHSPYGLPYLKEAVTLAGVSMPPFFV